MTVTLRRTQQMARALPPSSENPPFPDTALGYWYVTRLVVDRRPLLLLVCSRTLFPILVPARDVSTLPERLPGIVAAGLARANMPVAQIDRECAAMTPIGVAKTADRSLLGIPGLPQRCRASSPLPTPPRGNRLTATTSLRS